MAAIAASSERWRMTPAAIVEEVTNSGLRGRGGAGFPTGIKWRTVLSAAADQKYIVCNADEGDSGTFADRMIMEGDPFVLIEGMTIAGDRGRRHRGLHLYPLRISARLPHAAARHRRSPATRAIWAPTSRAAASASISKCGWAPAPTSAAKRPRCWKAWRASAAQIRSKPPLPAHRRACSASRR